MIFAIEKFFTKWHFASESRSELLKLLLVSKAASHLSSDLLSQHLPTKRIHLLFVLREEPRLQLRHIFCVFL